MSSTHAERRLAAILAADVVGYSRLIGADEAGTLARLRTLRQEVVEPLVAENGGRIFKTTGDGLLAEFSSVVQALRCAIAVQERLRGGELQLRVGVHQGDVVVQGDDLLGDGVNIAARLEALAEPGGICISGRVREDAAGKIALEVEDLGEPELKNIAQRHRVFRVRLGAPERPALALPDKPSLAVLPFQNMSGDPEQEYFADGMVEEITTALSRFSGLFVIARNSAFTYKGRAVDVRQVGRELGVRYVLEGSVRRAGGRVRFTAQLVEAATGSHIWAERYEGAVDDLFGLQDQITEAVAGNLEPTITEAEIDRGRRKLPGSPDAYDEYLRGLVHAHSYAPVSVQAMLDHSLRAIALDANFAPAYALAAYAHIQRKVQGWTEDAGKAEREPLDLVERGLRADRSDASMLAIAGHCFAYFAGDLAKGITFVNEALALNPNLAEGYFRSGILRNHAGEPEIAIEHFNRGLRLSPRDSRRHAVFAALALSYLLNGDLEMAHGWAQRAVQLNPEYATAWRRLAVTAALLRRQSDARHAADRVLAINPNFSIQQLRHSLPGFATAKFDRYWDGHRQAGLPE